MSLSIFLAFVSTQHWIWDWVLIFCDMCLHQHGENYGVGNRTLSTRRWEERTSGFLSIINKWPPNVLSGMLGLPRSEVLLLAFQYMDLNLKCQIKNFYGTYENKNKALQQNSNFMPIEYETGTLISECETNTQLDTIILNKTQIDTYGQEKQLNNL